MRPLTVPHITPHLLLVQVWLCPGAWEIPHLYSPFRFPLDVKKKPVSGRSLHPLGVDVKTRCSTRGLFQNAPPRRRDASPEGRLSAFASPRRFAAHLGKGADDDDAREANAAEGPSPAPDAETLEAAAAERFDGVGKRGGEASLLRRHTARRAGHGCPAPPRPVSQVPRQKLFAVRFPSVKWVVL